MKFIPAKYVVTDTNKPEGISYKCRFCGREFVVPNEEAAKLLFANPDVCEDCKDLYEKEEIAKAGASINEASNKETEDVINKALGN